MPNRPCRACHFGKAGAKAAIRLRCPLIFGKPVPQLMGAAAPPFARRVSLTRLAGTSTGKRCRRPSRARHRNPEFTASVLVAYARAVYRLSRSGEVGARTVFDIAPGLLSPKDPVQLRKELL